MCQKTTEKSESEARETPETSESSRHAGCRCEPRRCLPIAGVVLAAVAAPLVVRAIRRSRNGDGKQDRGRKSAGCCG